MNVLDSMLASGWLYALDPGTAKAGFAAFHNGRLVEAVTLHRPTPAVVRELALRDGKWVRERMHKYGKARAMHADLDAIEDFVRAIGVRWEDAYRPQRWKGNVPKAIHHGRLRDVLDLAERGVFDCAGEDGRDAIGIGLFALGRVGRGGMPT